MVPIIENTPFEKDLAGSLGEALRQYPGTSAVLVRRHGVYVWGETWQQAKTMWVPRNLLFYLLVPTLHGRNWTRRCIHHLLVIHVSLNYPQNCYPLMISNNKTNKISQFLADVATLRDHSLSSNMCVWLAGLNAMTIYSKWQWKWRNLAWTPLLIQKQRRMENSDLT